MKLETPTDANRHRQTYSNSTRQCLGVSGAGFLCLLVSVVVCWHIWFPEMSGRCLGWCLGGGQRISEWYSWKLELLGCGLGVSGFLALAVWSRNTILAQAWKAWLFSSDHTEISKYQNVHIWGWQKRLGFMIFLFLSARQKDIKNGSRTWTPCSIGRSLTHLLTHLFTHPVHKILLWRVSLCECMESRCGG